MKCTIFIFTLIVLFNYSWCQQNWLKVYGDYWQDIGFSVIQTYNNDFVITGASVPGTGTLWLLRVNLTGDVVWSRYSPVENEAWTVGQQVKETSDMGFIVIAWSSITDRRCVTILKTDSLGNQEWYKTYCDSFNISANSIIQDYDKGYVFTGYKSNDLWICKLDSLGEIKWSIVDTAYGEGHEIINGQDSTYLVVCDSYNDSTAIDANLLMYNSDGKKLWNRRYHHGIYDFGLDLDVTNDGGYIVAGGTDNKDTGYDFWVLKTNAYGDTIWTKSYGKSGTERAESISRADQNNFIITGYSYSIGNGSGYVWLVKIDSKGDTIWTRSYGGDLGADKAYSGQSTHDGGYILTGYTESFAKTGDEDLLLIKTDSMGNALVTNIYAENKNSPKEFLLKQNYPNPFNAITNFEFRISNFSNVELLVYNILGQKVATLLDEKRPAGQYKVTFDATGLVSGIYYYKLVVHPSTPVSGISQSSTGSGRRYIQTRKMLLLK